MTAMLLLRQDGNSKNENARMIKESVAENESSPYFKYLLSDCLIFLTV